MSSQKMSLARGSNPGRPREKIWSCTKRFGLVYDTIFVSISNSLYLNLHVFSHSIIRLHQYTYLTINFIDKLHLRYIHKLDISISGRVPGTRCSKLTGAFAPVAPVPTEGLYMVKNLRPIRAVFRISKSVLGTNLENFPYFQATL